MDDDIRECSIDIPFSVPFIHRLRVTNDVSEADFMQLLDVLETGDAGPPKVLVVAEKAVRDRAVRIHDQLAACDAIEMVGAPVFFEGGETVKNSSVMLKYLLSRINEANLDRRSYMIAIGGGAMLDAAGCAAAVAHRGIRLVRLPTTTLAQADSGVGVKNAINYFDKKNWIGTFAVPWAVINDAELLSSLSDRDFRSGFSEAVKVSLLKDRAEFDWLCEHADDIRGRDMRAAKRAIHRSCTLHLRHITEGGDPFEMLESRPLDFGHWSAHRLEPLSHYTIRHGEAVAIGVAIDCIYSSMKFGFPESEMLRVCRCLSELGLPLWHECLHPIDRLMKGLEEFRQHLGGRLTITMLRAAGEPINVHEIDASAMRSAIERLREM
jgi:3-dehydroquinate synthase